MFTAILSKIGIPALILVVGAIGGIGLQQKVFSRKPDKIDYAEVRSIVKEEVTKAVAGIEISIQPFEVDKMKGLRHFNYSPSYTGNVAVSGVDSVAIRRWMEESVMKAFEAHVVQPTEEKKRRRR
jgi:hypothetical protein